jgi:glutathione S-transferase
MIRLWGRTNSMNVQKVLWTLDELGLRYERLDAGMQFGLNNTPDYLKKNPNGKVPLLEDDGYAIWESQAICRYLCNQYQGSQLYPLDAQARGQVDQWLDWANSGVNNSLSVVFWQTLRLPEEQRDGKKLKEETDKTIAALQIFNRALSGRSFVATSHFSLADLAMAPVVFRCIGLGLVDLGKPDWSALASWYAETERNQWFKKWVVQPLR